MKSASNHYQRYLFGIGFLVLMGVCFLAFQNFSFPYFERSGRRIISLPKNGNYLKNIVFFKLKESPSVEATAAFESLAHEHNLSKVLRDEYQIRVVEVGNMKGLTELELAQKILDTDAVDYAFPDSLVAVAQAAPQTPNDPNFPSQWHLPQINAPVAWGEIGYGNRLVKVLVCDTGLEPKGSEFPTIDFSAARGVSTVEWQAKYTEPAGEHGTRVTGVLAARANNGNLIAGVAGNIALIPYKVTSSNGFTVASYITGCLAYGHSIHAHVVNLSIGLHDAYLYNEYGTGIVQQLFQNGTIFVQAAGNDNCPLDAGLCTPSGGGESYRHSTERPEAILVSSTDRSNQRPSWANYGSAVDLVAPGVEIYTTGWILGTSTTDKLVMTQGTSYSAPMVAGAAALIFSVNPNFTATQVMSFLYSTATPLPGYFGSGRGLLNIGAAVGAAKAVAGIVNIPPRAALKPLIPLRVPFWLRLRQIVPFLVSANGVDSTDSNGTIASYEFNFGDGSPVVNASTASYTYTVPGTYELNLTVTDNEGMTSYQAAAITALAPNPTLIYVESITMAPGKKGNSYFAKATISIKDGTRAAVRNATVLGTWTWNGTVIGASNGKTGPDGKTIITSASTSSGGKFTFTVTSVTATGKTYDSELSVETSDSVTQ